MGVRELYEQTLAERGYRSDPAQLRAVAALERCENEWLAYLSQRSNALAKLKRALEARAGDPVQAGYIGN